MDASYIAGLFDGEGCVSVYPKTGCRGFSIQCQMVQNQNSTSECLFKSIQLNYGGVIRYQKLYSGNVKMCLDMHGDTAAAFAEALTPFLVLKKEQAVISAAWHRSRQKHRDRDSNGRLVKISDEEYENNKKVAKLLSVLKKHSFHDVQESMPELIRDLSLLPWWPYEH